MIYGGGGGGGGDDDDEEDDDDDDECQVSQSVVVACHPSWSAGQYVVFRAGLAVCVCTYLCLSVYCVFGLF